MVLHAPEATLAIEEGNGSDFRCCVCGEVLPYHPAFCVDPDCPHCGSALWCFQRDHSDSIILEVLAGRTPSLDDIDCLTRTLFRSYHEPQVTVDLSALDIVNSALVAMLVLLNKRLRAAGGTLRLCGLNPVIREIFSRFKLNTLFEIEEDACV